MLTINDRTYLPLIPMSVILDIDLNHFDLRFCYEVLMVDRDTGDIRLMIWGMQSSKESAMGECYAHMNRSYEILDAWPIVERVLPVWTKIGTVKNGNIALTPMALLFANRF